MYSPASPRREKRGVGSVRTAESVSPSVSGDRSDTTGIGNSCKRFARNGGSPPKSLHTKCDSLVHDATHRAMRNHWWMNTSIGTN